MDELDNVFSGYRIFYCLDFEYRKVNPPLARLLTGFPWVFLDSTGCSLDPHEHKRQFVSRYKEIIPWMHFCSKLVVLLLAVACARYVYLFSRDLYDDNAGLASQFLFVVHPVVLAHSRLATTDMIFAALNVFCLYHAYRWRRTSERFHVVCAAVFLGLALSTKFSAVVLLCVVAPLIALRRPPWTWLLMFILLPLVIVHASYAFFGVLEPLAALGRPHSRVLQYAVSILPAGMILPLPLQYISGLDLQMFLNSLPFPQYLNGQWYPRPLLHYYPLVMGYKAPVIVALFCAALFTRRNRHMALFVLLPALAYLAVMSFASLNIGIRYVLPALVLMIIPAGAVLARLGRIGVVLAVALAVQSIIYFPHYLASFPYALGGPAAQHKYLLDSNIDWGQDLPLLKQYMEKKNLRHVYLAYFGNVDASLYGIETVPEPSQAEYAVISANLLYGHTIYLEDYELARPPFEQIAYVQKNGRLLDTLGYTLYVFRLPSHENCKNGC